MAEVKQASSQSSTELKKLREELLRLIIKNEARARREVVSR
jgi:hypothetical protein